jgi:hypothetical protein
MMRRKWYHLSDTAIYFLCFIIASFGLPELKVEPPPRDAEIGKVKYHACI